MSPIHENIKLHRTKIYFDCICGTVSSILALIGISVSSQQRGIINPTLFTIGLYFWIGYLVVSIFVIGLGIYTYYRAKNFDSDAIPKKKIKAPIVS